MRKFIMTIAALIMAGGIAFAASKVATFGVPNTAGTAPMEVDSDRVITTATDATVDFNGAVNVDAAVTVDSLTVDGSLYTAPLVVDGSIYLGRATLDPCATIGPGTIFINNTTGAPCFCNNLGVDLSLYNGTSACF
jgi:hypothetical protein